MACIQTNEMDNMIQMDMCKVIITDYLKGL
uniref:Uncharacterized protein n=1 Tax=Peduovirinae sp. ctOza1 TaxID=2825095 RepID=A0A8S5UVZ2_9CAUD|nr:MAG TPA: hypothetical protein [Peduovirinae sp. ctOza1]